MVNFCCAFFCNGIELLMKCGIYNFCTRTHSWFTSLFILLVLTPSEIVPFIEFLGFSAL